MKYYIRLLKFLKPYLAAFSVAIVCMFFSAAFSGVSLGMIVPLMDKIFSHQEIVISRSLPLFLKNFITKLNILSPSELLLIIAWLIPLLFILKGLFIFAQSFLMSGISQKVIRDIRDKLYCKLQGLSLNFFSKARTGELISQITYDVGLVQNSITEGLMEFVYQSLQIILFLGIVFFIHWRLAIISLILLPLVVLPVIKIGKKLRKISSRSQEKMGRINNILYETIAGIRIVKAFSMEDYEVKRFAQENNRFCRLIIKSIKRTIVLSPLNEFVGALSAAFILFFGGREVLRGTMSAGVFTLFLGALLSLMKPFKKVTNIYGLTQQALAAAKRIFKILDTQATIKEKEDAVVLSCFNKSIIFERVYFNYGEKEVLKDINLEVQKGEVVAFVGHSGVGKTTLVNLIPRFYDPYKGRVTIDGYDLRELTLKSLRDQIGIVTQETVLFNDTVRANIAYGRQEARLEEIIEAAKAANAHQFIVNLPEEYQTIIGEQGLSLSGGERQRLAIARAFLKGAPILILDEATSQLDSRSEKLIQEALGRLMQGKTVFVIAHRLSTVKNADKIVILDGGKIVDIGRHSELLSRDSLYKRLYEMQFHPVK
ncbi:MAG: ATP-binding cassette domain-containing protein [Candidatus Omnitrophica bacterium]|nr:ATP-binding cassette domain-containing protein [Candidatus Omnitrophota bacterium]